MALQAHNTRMWEDRAVSDLPLHLQRCPRPLTGALAHGQQRQFRTEGDGSPRATLLPPPPACWLPRAPPPAGLSARRGHWGTSAVHGPVEDARPEGEGASAASGSACVFPGPAVPEVPQLLARGLGHTPCFLTPSCAPATCSFLLGRRSPHSSGLPAPPTPLRFSLHIPVQVSGVPGRFPPVSNPLHDPRTAQNLPSSHGSTPGPYPTPTALWQVQWLRIRPYTPKASTQEQHWALWPGTASSGGWSEGNSEKLLRPVTPSSTAARPSCVGPGLAIPARVRGGRNPPVTSPHSVLRAPERRDLEPWTQSVVLH